MPPGLLNNVYFGCSGTDIISWTDTKIIVKAPTDMGTGNNDREFLKNFIKLVMAGWIIGEMIPGWVGDIPDWILDWIIDTLLACDLEITSDGRMTVPVRVDTHVGSSNVINFEYRISTIIEAYLHSPGELRIYNSMGNVTGLINGEIKEEIPRSLCDENSIIIVSPNGTFNYEVKGTDNGIYGLVINYIDEGVFNNFNATDIPTSIGAIHHYIINWSALSQGQEGVTVQIDSDGNGIFEKTITSDNELTHDEYILKIDDTPSITSKNIGNPKYGSNNEWVSSSTKFNLTATDDLSGVDAIYYRIWYNGAWTPWNEYTDNFTLTGEGKHYLEYYSIDNVGNVETTQNQTHYVDNTTPTVTVSASPNSLWPPNNKMKNVLISGSATDAGSGIASITFTVEDEYNLVEPTLTGFGQTIQLQAKRYGYDFDGRIYTITATATDNLGHVTTASTLVLVSHDQGN